MSITLDLSSYDKKNDVTIHLKIIDLPDLDLLDTGKIAELANLNPFTGYTVPILKRMIEETGARCNISVTDGWRKYIINTKFLVLQCIYELFGEEKYKRWFGIEVPNEQ